MMHIYPGNLSDLVDFAMQCRARRNDHLLLLQPGSDRDWAKQFTQADAA